MTEAAEFRSQASGPAHKKVAEILQKAGMDAVVLFPICSTTFFDRFKCAEVLSHCILVENNHRSKRGLDRDHCDRARV